MHGTNHSIRTWKVLQLTVWTDYHVTVKAIVGKESKAIINYSIWIGIYLFCHHLFLFVCFLLWHTNDNVIAYIHRHTLMNTHLSPHKDKHHTLIYSEHHPTPTTTNWSQSADLAQGWTPVILCIMVCNSPQWIKFHCSTVSFIPVAHIAAKELNYWFKGFHDIWFKLY